MLPRTLEMLRSRAGPQMTALARALGSKQAELADRVTGLGGGPRRLSELGADRSRLEAAVKGITARPELQLTPDVPGRAGDPRADRKRLVGDADRGGAGPIRGPPVDRGSAWQ